MIEHTTLTLDDVVKATEVMAIMNQQYRELAARGKAGGSKGQSLKANIALIRVQIAEYHKQQAEGVTDGD